MANELAFVVYGLEVLILGLILFGSYFGRILEIRSHHIFIYTALSLQLLIFLGWMLPGILTYTLTPVLLLHAISGSITLILSIYISVIFLKDKNQYDLAKLRHTKFLMILTTVMWIITFILGSIVFLELYIV